MTNPMKKMLLITGLVFVGIFGYYGVKKIIFIWIMSHYQQPAATISSATAKTATWQPKITSIGSLAAINGVDISAETPGMVAAIRFKSGQFVKQGEVIVLLDSQVEQADFKSSQAKLKLASINYQRDLILLKKNATSQSAVDTDLAQLQEAQANLESIQAKINQKTITAPFDGFSGIRQINLGQYIQAGSPIVTLQSLDPLYVKFYLPADNLAKIFINQPIQIKTNAESPPISGAITAISSKVDTDTRNLEVEATIPNTKLKLRPGMFVDVTVLLPQKQKIIEIPETAIAYSLHGDSVFIVQPDGTDKNNQPKLKVTRRFIKIGERRGDVVSILDGIKPGEQIVATGQLKLQDGAEVIVNNELH